eukprot:Skav211325  [mRNA]  locus=scaffold3035:143033:143290:- [translate_table: standard]
MPVLWRRCHWQRLLSQSRWLVQDGAFHFQLRMGETRCERFYLAVNKKATGQRSDRTVAVLVALDSWAASKSSPLMAGDTASKCCN